MSPERPMLIPRMLQIQEHHGFLPDEELERLARETSAPLHRLQEIVSFFPHFRQEWDLPPFVEVKICRDMSCHLAGSAELIHSAAKGLAGLARSDSDRVVITGVSCLGRCDRAPACAISRHSKSGHNSKREEDDEFAFHDRVYAGLSLAQLQTTVQAVIDGVTPPPEHTPDLPYAAGKHGNWRIDVYQQTELPRYEATRRYLKRWPQTPRFAMPPRLSLPKDIDEREKEKRRREHDEQHHRNLHPWLYELKVAFLLGMGGAGAPAYQKWFDVWQAKGNEKYIVCNGDESEPGTFKDREILAKMPHLVVEGMLLALLMTGATAGYIFIRHEYQEQIDIVSAEIRRAAEALAGAFQETGQPFPALSVYTSPGGYICGEQSALIEAMEDKRAQPRNRPPELQTNGLFDKPTVVNNVETLAWVPFIMLNDRQGEGYVVHGKPNCKGLRLFSISGDLNKPGVFEVPIGTKLGDLMAMAGGVRSGRRLQAVATSGPSGGFLPAHVPVRPDVRARLKRATGELREDFQRKLLDAFAADNLLVGDGQAASFDVCQLPLDLGFFRIVKFLVGVDIDFMLGAGLVVYDDSHDMLAEARNCTQFFRNESCGKCVPCRIGSQKLVEVGTTLMKRCGVHLTDDDAGGLLAPDEFMNQVSENVAELTRVMALTSICGLGQVAANPLATALQFFVH